MLRANDPTTDLIANARKLRDNMVNFVRTAATYPNLSSNEIRAMHEIFNEVCDASKGDIKKPVAKEETDVELLNHYAARLTRLHTVGNRDELYVSRTVSNGVFSGSTTYRERGLIACDLLRIYYEALEPANLQTMMIALQSLHSENLRLREQVGEAKEEKAQVQQRLLDALLPVGPTMQDIQESLKQLTITNGESHDRGGIAPGSATATQQFGIHANGRQVVDDAELRSTIDRFWQAFSPQRQDILRQMMRLRAESDSKAPLAKLQTAIFDDLCDGTKKSTSLLLQDFTTLKLVLNEDLDDDVKPVSDSEVDLARATQRVVALFQLAKDATAVQAAKIPFEFNDGDADIVLHAYNESHPGANMKI